MSALLQSGRSDKLETAEIKGRFRPEAVIEKHRLVVDNSNRLTGERTHIVRLSDIVTRLQYRTAPCQHEFNF